MECSIVLEADRHAPKNVLQSSVHDEVNLPGSSADRKCPSLLKMGAGRACQLLRALTPRICCSVDFNWFGFCRHRRFKWCRRFPLPVPAPQWLLLRAP